MRRVPIGLLLSFTEMSSVIIYLTKCPRFHINGPCAVLRVSPYVRAEGVPFVTKHRGLNTKPSITNWYFSFRRLVVCDAYPDTFEYPLFPFS